MGNRGVNPVLLLILYILLFSVFLSFSINVSEASSSEWNIEYPSLTGRGHSIIRTEDGGYAIAGESEGHFLLLKINSFGELQWFKKYEVGGAYSIVQTNDGGYVLAGSGNIYNFFKTDSSGNIQWNWTYPHLLRSLITTSDGGYALVGHHGSLNIAESALFVKTDANGNKQWDKFYGSGMSYFLSIVEANEGGFAITGVISQLGLLIKTDYDGNIQWNKTYGEARCLIKTKDGGYMLAQSGGSLTKTDSLGEMQWNKIYGGESILKRFFSVTQISEGGFVAVGETYPVYNGLAWFIKTNISGDLLGEVLFEPTEGINNRAYSVIEADDGGYVFTGSNDSGHVWVVKIDPANIPEFPSWTPLLIMLVAVIVVAVIYKRRLKLQTN